MEEVLVRSDEEIDSGWRSTAWRRCGEEAAVPASPASMRAPPTPHGRSYARRRPLAHRRSIQCLAAATDGRGWAPLLKEPIRARGRRRGSPAPRRDALSLRAALCPVPPDLELGTGAWRVEDGVGRQTDAGLREGAVAPSDLLLLREIWRRDGIG
ncbi:unnamed protein product [Urochloa humidicola]